MSDKFNEMTEFFAIKDEEYSNDNNATFIVYKDKVIDMWEN